MPSCRSPNQCYVDQSATAPGSLDPSIRGSKSTRSTRCFLFGGFKWKLQKVLSMVGMLVPLNGGIGSIWGPQKAILVYKWHDFPANWGMDYAT